jgi:hypothetical protein
VKQLIRLVADVMIEVDTDTPNNLPEKLVTASLSVALVSGLTRLGGLPEGRYVKIVSATRKIEVVDK